MIAEAFMATLAPWNFLSLMTLISPVDPRLHLVQQAETRRIEMLARIAPSVVCISNSQERGGGSGVVIDAEGYGLTNFHVVAGMLHTGRGWGGLSDGKLYELQVLGIDLPSIYLLIQLVDPWLNILRW